MKVPFLDLRLNYQSVKEEINKEIQEVLDTAGYILGPKVEAFEARFAEAHQAKHAIGVSSGTDGNHLALWALGVGPGDEVIMPANTFIATAWGITLTGATPVFVDCDPLTYNIDPAMVEKAITTKTRAIIAVHLYGNPANMDGLRDLAVANNIFLIEDAAQAHLAQFKGQMVGGLGEISSFSFYPGKNLGAYGEGGAVLTNNDELAVKVKMIRDQGQAKKYHHHSYGHNYRMEAIQGAVLGVKLKYLEEWTRMRRMIADKYNENLNNLDGIFLPTETAGGRHVYHLYVIQTEDRDGMKNYLDGKGIVSGLHYPIPIHMQKCFQSLGYRKGDFPVTEQLADRCLSLPMFPEMTTEQVQYVSENVRLFATQKATI
ncbi:MAG: DegT/DnrJ/EryC1/StrS family aminotransferase [Flavobacteriales bacterium]|nr:DegT/DnrJ/EryC1/StrS family aminotransferase [Flavobacteriales bacterium]